MPQFSQFSSVAKLGDQLPTRSRVCLQSAFPLSPPRRFCHPGGAEEHGSSLQALTPPDPSLRLNGGAGTQTGSALSVVTQLTGTQLGCELQAAPEPRPSPSMESKQPQQAHPGAQPPAGPSPHFYLPQHWYRALQKDLSFI